ncbi:hypothetical protein [Ensifer aridi]|uniref:hypothetical protein n=1 Tax=Ensifer aridi TaxID=1708715 RepID=UPI00047D7315|nr:hypothetical protein [Ensifer aridi]
MEAIEDMEEWSHAGAAYRHSRLRGAGGKDDEQLPAGDRWTTGRSIRRVNIAEMSDIHTCQALLAMMVISV